MRIVEVIWLDEIVQKLIWKHQVERYEVVEVLETNAHFRFVEKGHRPGENVFLASGRTHAGRYLSVFFVYKQDQRVLILSAREMTPKEKRAYGRKK